MRTCCHHWSLIVAFSLAAIGTAAAQDSDAQADASASPSSAGPRPLPELIACEIGTTPNVHRFGQIFLAGQPPVEDWSAAQKSEGLRTVINLRTPLEMIGNGQEAELKKLGIAYHHLPFGAPDTLTDEVFDAAREVVADRKNHPIMMHCKSANRVGAIWLVHRVLDDKLTYDAALEEAHEVGLRFPPYEEKAKAYIARHEEQERRRAELLDKLADEWQYPNVNEDSGGGANGSIRNSVQKCEDGYGKVWEFYAHKCGFEHAYSEKKLYRTVRSEGRTTYLLDDHPRSVDGKQFRVRTFFVTSAPGYSVSILILRSEDESPETPTRVYRTITLQNDLSQSAARRIRLTQPAATRRDSQ